MPFTTSASAVTKGFRRRTRMPKKYSVLIFPMQGTRMHRLVFSRLWIHILATGGAALLGIGLWFFIDYSRMKDQTEEIALMQGEARSQQEKLSALEEQTKNLQKLLAHWKGSQEKIRASLPAKQRSSLGKQQTVEELEKSLSSLKGELERLIASIPSEWPVRGRVTSGVGMRLSPWNGEPEFHGGIDIPNPLGTPVHASGDAVVEWVGQKHANGLTVVLDHGQGIVTQYLHLSKILVKKGDKVKKGQPIAKVGNTGRSTSAHLHYEVRINGIPIDPRRKLLGSSPSSAASF